MANPNIPLMVQQPQVGQGILQLANIRQQGIDRQEMQKDVQQDRKVRGLQIQQAESQIAENQRNEPTRRLQEMNEREKAWLNSVVPAAAQTVKFLERGDIEGARTMLSRRVAALKEAGVSSEESVRALELLDKDPQSLLQGSRDMVNLGIEAGIIQPQAQDGFTLSEGQKRYDAQGNLIAESTRQQTPLTDIGKARLDYTSGNITLDEFNSLASQQVAPPAGFRYKEDNTLEPIPGGPKDVATTAAQDAVDREFAKEYTAFVASGGFSDVQKQLEQLDEVADQLESGANLTGPVIGRTPEFILQQTMPEVIAARDAVEEVVQRNLRLVLGAQFTEREGERLIARAYNPALDEKENAKRVRRLITQISSSAEAKAEASRYYEENGTLAGWKGRLPSLSDFDRINKPTEKEDPLGIL